MEPQKNSPPLSPEQPSFQPKNSEKGKNLFRPKTSEALPAQPLEQLRSVETHEQMTGAGVADNTPPAAAAVVPTLTAPPPPLVADDTNAVGASTNPATAADDDVIEKEWVVKSKRVVAATKGNPYLKEREVSKLQADYLFKRYNKEVKIPEDV